MKIGIIVAMDKELRLLLPLLEGHTTETVNGISIHRGTLGCHSLAVVKCGIGKVNAAIGALTLIEATAPQLVINTGVAGGTGIGARCGDVVAGARVAYHDVWCGPGTNPGEADGCPLFFTPPAPVLGLPALDGVRKGLIASGDIFISKKSEVDTILAMYPDAIAVDMESAPLAQTCFKRGVDFLSVRVVSDTPGSSDDNVGQYENFWERVPHETFGIVTRLLAELH